MHAHLLLMHLTAVKSNAEEWWVCCHGQYVVNQMWCQGETNVAGIQGNQAQNSSSGHYKPQKHLSMLASVWEKY